MVILDARWASLGNTNQLKELEMKLPIEVNNSKIPVFLSRFAPINIQAFSFGIWIFCRGEFSTRMRNHERIHYLQQLELLFVGQFILYGIFWLWKLVETTRENGKLNPRLAYFENPFEREAYNHDVCPYYYEERKPYAWMKYLRRRDLNS